MSSTPLPPKIPVRHPPPTVYPHLLSTRDQNNLLLKTLEGYDFFGRSIENDTTLYTRGVNVMMFLTTLNVLVYIAIWQLAQYANPLAGHLLLAYTVINAIAALLCVFTTYAFNKNTKHKTF